MTTSVAQRAVPTTAARPQAPRTAVLPRLFRSIAMVGSALSLANRTAAAYDAAQGSAARQRVLDGFMAELNRGAAATAATRVL